MSTATTPYYDKLCQHFHQIYQFEHFSALGNWDQATVMPPLSMPERSEAMATLAVHIHRLKTATEVAQYIARAHDEPLSESQQANLRETHYQYSLANMVPAALVEKKSALSLQFEHEWRQQRQQNDWQGFKPNLAAMLDLVKQESDICSQKLGIAPYDTQLQKFEPEMTMASLDGIFDKVAQWLPTLITQVVERQQSISVPQLDPPHSTEAQLSLSTAVMTLLGFDFQRGRLDLSDHPFSGGVAGDLRITSRFEPQDFTSGLFSTIHETGHARYEQGLPHAWRGQAAGMARSMAIHESQSLFFEMQLGRDPAFLDKLTPLINEHLTLQLTKAQLTDKCHQVKPGFIRVDADEVTYPCHIILRYAAEKALLNGDLSVDELPDFWSTQMQQWLGVNTDDNYRDGCMQDVHWAVGEFGYFPSYSLGAMYAAQFSATMSRTLAPLATLIQHERMSDIFSFLEQHIWSQGSLLTPAQLMLQVTGEALNPDYLRQHLQRRYLK